MSVYFPLTHKHARSTICSFRDINVTFQIIHPGWLDARQCAYGCLLERERERDYEARDYRAETCGWRGKVEATQLPANEAFLR